MPPSEHDLSYLWDMLQQARGIIRALAGRTFEDYARDEDLRMATERRIEIIGEAARRVSHAFRQTHPEVPWDRIVAQRNVLAHEYGEIQDDLLWRVATVSVPQLVALLEPLVPEASEREG